MLGSRDQWLRHVVGNPTSALLREDLESSLTAVIERALGPLATAFPERFRGETIKLARFAAGNLAQEGRASALATCAELRDFPGAALDSLPLWLGTCGNVSDWARNAAASADQA